MKKTILFLLLASCFSIIQAQSDHITKENKVKFGISTGINCSLLHANSTLPNNSEIINGIGSKIAFLMDYPISKNFIFSPKVEFAFNNCTVEIPNSLTNTTTSYEVFPATFNFMSHFLYRIGNSSVKPYVLLGPGLILPVNVKQQSTSDFTSPVDFAMDIGIGFEKHFKKWILAPEIRYSKGFRNVNRNPHLNELNFDQISLVLGFK